MKLRGLVQVHTNVGSADSRLTFRQLSKFILKNNISFVLLSEHFESLNVKKYDEVVRNCISIFQKHGKMVIPGIEWKDKNGSHFMFLGLFQFPKTYNMTSIKKSGSTIVLAHPNVKQLDTVLNNKEYKDKIDGFEVLNLKYHRKEFVLKMFDYLSHHKLSLPKLIGLDSHSYGELYKLGIVVNISKPKNFRSASKEILRKIKLGEYHYFFSNQEFSLPQLKILGNRIFILTRIRKNTFRAIRKVFSLP